jgi:hypothetical protein
VAKSVETRHPRGNRRAIVRAAVYSSSRLATGIRPVEKPRWEALTHNGKAVGSSFHRIVPDASFKEIGRRSPGLAARPRASTVSDFLGVHTKNARLRDSPGDSPFASYAARLHSVRATRNFSRAHPMMPSGPGARKLPPSAIRPIISIERGRAL